MPPLPSEITRTSSASACPWIACERRSGTFMVFPTSEPPPSGPWHTPHFVRNVAVMAALAWVALACAIEIGKPVSPTISAVRIEELKIKWCLILSRDMTFPFLASFRFGSGRISALGAADVSLGQVLKSVDPLLSFRLQRKWHCRTLPQTAALLARRLLLEECRYRRYIRSSAKVPLQS